MPQFYYHRINEILDVNTGEEFYVGGFPGVFCIDSAGDFQWMDGKGHVTDEVNPYAITAAINYGVTPVKESKRDE